eukprot:TRINITY_DN28042_c0_g1_i1.p1 TRINITY_DN28042_c0_g1~~TRINITY_DN28042_c0_g1_i1.p1  ORF type:complete len:528 (+),score=91.20 TRINITY_DN28042_c0_g1_i1:94-1677(+)
MTSPRRASLFEHHGIRLRASAAKSAVASLRDQTEASLVGAGVNCDAAKPQSDVGTALAALGLLGRLNIEYVTSYCSVNEQLDLEVQSEEREDTSSPGVLVSPCPEIQDTRHWPASFVDGCMQLELTPTPELPEHAEPKPEPCHQVECNQIAKEQIGSSRETPKEDAQRSAATWQPDDVDVVPESHQSGLAWLGRTSTASLGSRRLLLQADPRLNSPRHLMAHEKDPASADAPLAAMYGPGAARSMRLGEFRRSRPGSMRSALVSLNSSMRSSHPSSARVQRELQPSADAEIEVHDVPDQQKHMLDLAVVEQPLSAPSQSTVEGALSFTKRAADPDYAMAMVALKCGHRLALSRLSAAQKAAELVSGAGFAAQGMLICPFCGEQACPSHDGLKAYSSSADEYVGELRKDYQVPLRMPQPPPRVAVNQQIAGAVTLCESASSSAATSASGSAWTAELLRSRRSLEHERGGLRSFGAGPRTAPAATTASGSWQRPLLASKLARSAAASVLSSLKPPHTAPAKLRSALGSL